jgi:hypothetical protein
MIDDCTPSCKDIYPFVIALPHVRVEADGASNPTKGDFKGAEKDSCVGGNGGIG